MYIDHLVVTTTFSSNSCLRNALVYISKARKTGRWLLILPNTTPIQKYHHSSYGWLTDRYIDTYIDT